MSFPALDSVGTFCPPVRVEISPIVEKPIVICRQGVVPFHDSASLQGRIRGANPVYHRCHFPGKPGRGTSALRRRKSFFAFQGWSGLRARYYRIQRRFFRSTEKAGKGGGLMAEIRLMVSCHQMEEVPPLPLLRPIQVVAALSSEPLRNEFREVSVPQPFQHLRGGGPLDSVGTGGGTPSGCPPGIPGSGGDTLRPR